METQRQTHQNVIIFTCRRSFSNALYDKQSVEHECDALFVTDNTVVSCAVRKGAQLTQQVHSKLMLSDVLEQGGEDGQQGHCGVVDILRHALHLTAGVCELPQFQILQSLLQILCCILKESPQSRLHQLRAGLHHC